MRNIPKRRAKIVATIGPACDSSEMINKLIVAGINVARLNFSHGDYESHGNVVRRIREESEKLNKSVAILQDLCGPKMRIGMVHSNGLLLKEGKKIKLSFAEDITKTLGTEDEIFLDAFNPAKEISKDEKILLADGRISLQALELKGSSAICKVLNDGTLRSRAGVSIPESEFSQSCLTTKDREDIAWAMEHDIDYVALSFVGSHLDIIDARKEMSKYGTPLPVIAKIERARALDNINDIIETADAVMVARGDLGVDLPLQRVPGAQRLIIKTANFDGTPVITATQMLVSMVDQVRPTRAEVSDVVTAIRDGTDAVMLSEETAVGSYPLESVETLSKIVEEAENELALELTGFSSKHSDRANISDAVCFAACNAAEKISATAIIACTESGYTARLMSKYRPLQPLLGVTSQTKSLTRMALYWGVEPARIDIPRDADTESEIREAINTAKENYGVKQGSRLVITAGLRTKATGSTNVMEIREVPRST
jgi:pyruvate kinase